MTAIVAKCDTLFGVVVEGVIRQFRVPARLRRQTAVFVPKLAKNTLKSRNSNKRQDWIHCFLKRTPPPRASEHSNGEKTAACFAVGSVSSSKPYPGWYHENEGFRPSVYLVT